MKEKICEAEIDGFCSGCDETSRENIENNYFDYYEHKKVCETLQRYRNLKNKQEKGMKLEEKNGNIFRFKNI